MSLSHYWHVKYIEYEVVGMYLLEFFNYNCFLSFSSFPLPCFFRLPGIAARQPSRQAGQVAALKMEPRHRKQNEDEHEDENDDEEHDADD